MSSVPETLVTDPVIDIPLSEYHRLLGYPPGHEPDERIEERVVAARTWYAAHGAPWIYWREVPLELVNNQLVIDGHTFDSPRLQQHLLRAGAQRVILAAVGAGGAIADRAAELWADSKPDEYFFAEVYGSAVVENLVSSLHGRICEAAETTGFRAIPHYSPGHEGWDVAEQNRLFEIITQNQTQTWPELLAVLSSGMLTPKKSRLGVFGLAAKSTETPPAPDLIPCEHCGFESCPHRRAAYIHATIAIAEPPPLNPKAEYTVARRALRKWADQRVRLTTLEDGRIEAHFRFDGSTCSNMGQPLTFDYRVLVAPAADQHRILETDCQPAAGDTGHAQQCAWLSNPDSTRASIAEPPALLGHPLDDVLNWQRETRQSGCYCDASSRAHKWGLALETIHFALSTQSLDQ